MNNRAMIWERTWAEIDLGALRHNSDPIRGSLPAGVKLCCVVKANGYGHGASKLAPLYQQLGADWFAVSNIEEAMQLRRAGVTRPVLILGYTHPSCAELLADNGFSQCVYSAEYGRLLSAAATACGTTVKVHIKLDTGMGRLGFQVTGEGEDSVSGAIATCRLAGLEPEGVFTHFATADFADKSFAGEQYAKFERFIELCKERGVEFEHITCDNTAAAMEMPVTAKTEVRIGIGLYGYYPSDEVKSDLELTPAMTIKSHIVSVKEIEAGQSVGYGRTFTAQRKTRLATIPIGYADGYPRLLSNKGYVLINGQRAPIIGNVCMDMFMVDITDIDAHDGDEVIAMGEGIDADTIAKMCQTISYEIICGIGSRVKRVYI